jgi:hypothetical protein
MKEQRYAVHGIMRRVRRRTAMVALWALGTMFAAFVAWRGVAVVGDAVTGDRPDALSGDDVATALAAASASTASTASTGESTSAPSTGAPSGTSATTARPRTPTTNLPATAPPTTAPSGSIRNYNLVGGTATIRFTPTSVTVVLTRPRDGFSVRVEQQSPTSVEVRFESDDHESRLEAFWSGGPRDDIEERDEGGGGGGPGPG